MSAHPQAESSLSLWFTVVYIRVSQAYYWLRQNTPENAKVMSWWDYGYQITAMANRTILVDNNTWNNTHISRVGQVGGGICVVHFAWNARVYFGLRA